MIEEILINNIKNEIETTKEKDFALCIEQWKQLLVYITNLQQENETLKAKLEIGKTCGFCPYYDYKSRCKKAIEYIHKYTYNPSQTINDERLEVNPKYLLNILKGSDNNE